MKPATEQYLPIFAAGVAVMAMGILAAFVVSAILDANPEAMEREANIFFDRSQELFNEEEAKRERKLMVDTVKRSIGGVGVAEDDVDARRLAEEDEYAD